MNDRRTKLSVLKPKEDNIYFISIELHYIKLYYLCKYLSNTISKKPINFNMIII